MQRRHLPFAHSFTRYIFMLTLGLTASFSSVQAQQPKGQTPKTFTYKIINSPNNTFGYNIYAAGKLLVHQPSKPALPGNEGFATRIATEKVARLVITKLKKGEMPPTVSVEEMKKLNSI